MLTIISLKLHVHRSVCM